MNLVDAGENFRASKPHRGRFVHGLPVAQQLLKARDRVRLAAQIERGTNEVTQKLDAIEAGRRRRRQTRLGVE